MPIIKHISVHKHPLKMFEYVLNGDKTSEMKFVSGINCTPIANLANNEFEKVFEKFSGERFYKNSLNEADEETTKKQKVRLHHYIQSFAPGEATPEEAHRIGVEWARKVFGDKHQVIVSTHIDMGHLHNHFAVAAYNLEGKAWCDNKKTLKYCRDISDRIAREHGLSVIGKTKYRANHKYGEWLARKNGTSWKAKLCDDIDRIILQDNVKSIDDLIKELQNNGYEVTRHKYISVKPAYLKNRKPVRTLRLGDGYGFEELQYRIENKNQEMPLSEAMKYEGVQREYALCLRQLQITVYRNIENPVQAGYGDLRKSAELLTFLCDKNIHSLADFENIVNETADKAAELKQKKKSIEDEISDLQRICITAERFAELNSKAMPNPKEMKELREMKKSLPPDISGAEDISKYAEKLELLKSQLVSVDESLSEAESLKREYGKHYSLFIQQAQSDYDIIREKAYAEQAELERAAEQHDVLREQEEQTHHINRWVK